MKISALIPVKTFRNAKQRLSPRVGLREREALAETMFREVLGQALQTPRLSAVYVVTGDDGVASLAASLGANVIREESENGETEAVDFARARLAAAGCEALLILPADLPLVRKADIEAVLSHLTDDVAGPFALLVPSHDRMGTNALLLSPPGIIPLRFGYDSFSYHMSQVAALGLPLRSLENEHIALDIDEPKDLERLLAFRDESTAALAVARSIWRARRPVAGDRAGEL
ncbi:MAG TPA: 2-phospho-L-lactate guanylyltransferase [Candidatus Eisenbacteria bacterium]|nr:2-phospho-L-lactate guanylyltransferase [Candidatus Eisenbacteria bacterium]